MKVLLTGGLGFIGRHVAINLFNAGHDVAVIDKATNDKIANCPPHIKCFIADLINPNALEDVFRVFKPEIVDHHAGSVGIMHSMTSVSSDAQINIIGSVNLFDLSVKYNVKRIIFASTGAIYGNQDRFPIIENSSLKPNTPYGISKLCAENYLNYYHDKYGIESVILRYANVYGKKLVSHNGRLGVVELFLQKALNGKELVIHGDGNTTRDFVYVEDAANANVLAVRRKEGIYNIGSGMESSLKHLVEVISTVLGRKIPYRYEADENRSVKRFVLDITKAKVDLGYTPRFSLPKAIKKMVDLYERKSNV